MKKIIAVISLVSLTAFALFLTRDGQQTTPVGRGTVVLDAGAFEAFPLPPYAAAQVTQEYLSYLVEVEPGIKVHVLEVGSGFPVYAQHGNPTSGFLYRKVAAELPTDQVRVIMPTLVGLGFSSKVPASAHTLENHVRWMNEVLVQLQLTEAVYVGQDWGGPVGMGALARSPELLRGAVVMNTGFNAPTEPMELSSAHARVRTPVVGEFFLEFVVSIFDQMHRVQGDPASIPAAIGELYGRPLRESGNAKAPVALMRMVTDGPQHPSAEVMREIEAYVDRIDIPAELVWGMNDPILAQGLPQMRENFPDAPVTETEAGHFLQEEVPDVIAAAIMRVVDAVLALQQDGAGDAPALP